MESLAIFIQSNVAGTVWWEVVEFYCFAGITEIQDELAVSCKVISGVFD
jgi:hypothetical protein